MHGLWILDASNQAIIKTWPRARPFPDRLLSATSASMWIGGEEHRVHGTENAIRILAAFTSWFMCHLCKCGRLSCEPPLLNSFTLVPCTSKPKQHEHTLCWVLPVLLVVTQTFLQPQTIYIYIFCGESPKPYSAKKCVNLCVRPVMRWQQCGSLTKP
jgi:hypothetical protein